ncbi:hypothetical protein GOA89_14745 [Sinorhizobium meliloti]|nr:hypothetical protein [Sinorhizobium meliloti]MDW9847555.1 hypothetical protein [Sinorhizobium meliloti]MDX0144062.1 hypothetical protein [Sinorhizobium meliloti]MDX0150487.1 hypothetical protein [Sinorhizobium meliloti]MDX0169733.1 hypothetical protein [Sinorhizobium meliloti]
MNTPSHAVDGTSDQRTVNNAVRHTYRVLTDAEKAQMVAIKDKGAELLALIRELDGSPSLPGSRELFISHQKVEEAVMWAVKHITA